MNAFTSKSTVLAALGLSAALVLAGCGKKADNTTTTAPMSPSTSPSTMPSTGSTGSGTTPGSMAPGSPASAASR